MDQFYSDTKAGQSEESGKVAILDWWWEIAWQEWARHRSIHSILGRGTSLMEKYKREQTGIFKGQKEEQYGWSVLCDR